jgi:hypothetical protein
MIHNTAELLLPVFVMVGLAGCIWLGYLLGSEHTALLTRMVSARVRIIRRQRRRVARARGERALALAQRDDALRQLALADAALAEATHPVQHAEDLPEQDPRLEALVRAVTDEAPVGDGGTWLRGESV